MTFTIQDPAQGSEQYPSLMGLIGTLKGYANWSGPIDHIGFESNSRYAHVTRNLGTGGHQIWRKSTDNSQLVAITDAGLAVTALTATSLTVTPGATSLQAMTATTGAFSSTLSAAATSVTTLTASSTVQGTRLISTVATGTAPLTVASTTKVDNLNADLLDGQNAADFLTTTTGDARYLQLTGGSLSGLLTMEPTVATDQIVKFKGSTTSGGFFIGATNVAAPALMFRDNANTLMAQVNPAGSTYALDVNVSTPATNAARFAGDVLIVDDLGVNNINATGSVSGASVVVTTGGITVEGSSSFDDGVSFDNGIHVSAGSSLFDAAVTISAGGLSITTGGLQIGTPPNYTVTNPSDLRSIDVSTITLANLARVVGTIIEDIQDMLVFS